MPSPFPEAAVGAIVAAFIAATVALLGLVISKEQKTSEFRQDWIDSLRKEVADLIAHANAIHGARVAAGLAGKRIAGGLTLEQFESQRDHLVSINTATALIRLRLNVRELPSQTVLATIDELEKMFWGGGTISAEALNATEKKLVEQTAVILKTEWNRVRDGERTFRITKSVAAGATVIAIIALLAKLL